MDVYTGSCKGQTPTSSSHFSTVPSMSTAFMWAAINKLCLWKLSFSRETPSQITNHSKLSFSTLQAKRRTAIAIFIKGPRDRQRTPQGKQTSTRQDSGQTRNRGKAAAKQREHPATSNTQQQRNSCTKQQQKKRQQHPSTSKQRQ
ncbi:hypothetical protein QYF36_017393 [Acer negundo]|nr:hypothetical protein QYF36_017393 [Acer negundo]